MTRPFANVATQLKDGEELDLDPHPGGFVGPCEMSVAVVRNPGGPR